MGDRALVIFKNGDELSPVTYLHWHGSTVETLLKKTRARMDGRAGDLSYTAARFVGVCHENISGNLSLGIWNSPGKGASGLAIATGENYSHGDAGVFIVDVSGEEWEAEAFHGYGFRDGSKKKMILFEDMEADIQDLLDEEKAEVG